MLLYQAVKMLGLRDISSISEKVLKANYKKLMKENHPDVGGNEETAKNINEAYDLITRYISKTSEIAKGVPLKSIIMVSMSDLNKIYNGETISYTKEDRVYSINKHNIQDHRVLVNCEVKVETGGEVRLYEEFMVLNSKNIYEITCQIEDEQLGKRRRFRVTVADVTVLAEIGANVARIKINISDMLMCIVRLERTIKE